MGLLLLVGGALYLNQFRAGLIELRAQALAAQAAIIAAAIAEAAGEDGARPALDPARANLALRRLAPAAGARARMFDHGGRLIGDSREAELVQPIESKPLPPPGAADDTPFLARAERAYSELIDLIFGPPALYRETLMAGVSAEEEVYRALTGELVVVENVNSEGELIVSVARPIQRFKAVLGALVLSTQGGDIDRIVRQERMSILRWALIAVAVSVLLSLLLARSIAQPLRRLANAADRLGRAATEAGTRPELPDFSDRADEIGRLSGALSRMTDALYDRIDAIETFAADVAHEIKNPLSSLRSAVEVLDRATPEARARLIGVITHDVRRLDRLVTDISNASRLDAELVREARAPLDLAALARAVADICAQAAERRGVALRVAGPTRLMVPGMETRLGQVARNLIENAISFARSAVGVRVEARAEGGAKVVRLIVEDDGPGLPVHALEAVFDRFWTERPEGEAFGEHSGLGLSIARQIVEAHGGTLVAANREGGGARFVATLPQ